MTEYPHYILIHLYAVNMYLKNIAKGWRNTNKCLPHTGGSIISDNGLVMKLKYYPTVLLH